MFLKETVPHCGILVRFFVENIKYFRNTMFLFPSFGFIFSSILFISAINRFLTYKETEVILKTIKLWKENFFNLYSNVF